METVAQLVVRRVTSAGLAASPGATAFGWHGVPGDYSFPLHDALEDVPAARWFGDCNELCAGYAADGYARVAGLGALLITYGVGDLSAANAIAGAFAERVPLVVVSSAPRGAVAGATVPERTVHHSLAPGVRSDAFATALGACVCAAAWLTPANAAEEVERVLAECVARSLPVLITVPLDVQTAIGAAPISPTAPTLSARPALNPSSLAALASAVAARLASASSPVVLVGAGIGRAPSAPAALAALLSKLNLPAAVVADGRALVDETGPFCLGVYGGDRSFPPSCRETVDASDCVLRLGVRLRDVTTGGFTAAIQHESGDRVVSLDICSAVICGTVFEGGVPLAAALDAIAKAAAPRSEAAARSYWRPRAGNVVAPRNARDIKRSSAHIGGTESAAAAAAARAPLRVDDVLDGLSGLLRPGDVLVVETCCAAFGLFTRTLPPGVTAVSQEQFGSIGYALPAAGGCARACSILLQPTSNRRRRVVLLTGDGSVHACSGALAAQLRDTCSLIALIVDNEGYTTERALCSRPTSAYNDTPRWRLASLPHALGGTAGVDFDAFTARTVGECVDALAAAVASCEAGRLAWVVLSTPKHDVPAAAEGFFRGARVAAAEAAAAAAAAVGVAAGAPAKA